MTWQLATFLMQQATPSHQPYDKRQIAANSQLLWRSRIVGVPCAFVYFQIDDTAVAANFGITKLHFLLLS
jgi:hypothetical protein